MKPKQLKLGTPVHVKWIDSMGGGGWKYDLDHAGQIAHIQSIGFIINTQETHLTMTTSLGNKQGAIDPLAIPWGCIQDLTLIDNLQ